MKSTTQIIKASKAEPPYFTEIKVKVIGDFAFHHEVRANGDPLKTYIITHVPSGLAVTRGITYAKVARELTERLATLPDKWNPKKPPWENQGKEPKRYPKKFKESVKATVLDFKKELGY